MHHSPQAVTVFLLSYEGAVTTGSKNQRVCAHLALAVTATLWLYFMVHEIVTVGSATSEKAAFCVSMLWGSVWDIVQLASLGTVAATVVLNVQGHFQEATVVAAFALPLIWFNLLYFLQGFKATGTLV